MDQHNSRQGFLTLIGGAEDKKGKKIVLQRLIETTGAKNILIIPTASTYPKEVFNHYHDAFKGLGVENVECLNIRYKEEADKEENFEKLNNAELVFFGGGDQVILVEAFENSRLIADIKQRFLRGDISIAGSSAGAAAASNPMIYDGDYKGFNKGTVNHGAGFGFIEEVTVDTHFLNRERIPRLVQFLSAGLSNKAIGLEEDTGIIISPDLNFEVIGSGMVTVFFSDQTMVTNFDNIQKDEFFSVNNIKIGFLAPGISFDLKTWTVQKEGFKKKALSEFIKDTILN